MKKIKWFVNHIEEIISSVLLFVVFIFLMISIVGRLVGINTSMIQELIQYCFIVSILFGVSYAAKEREHIRADMLLESVSAKTKGQLLLVADVVWLFFSASMAVVSVPFIYNMYDYSQKTAMLQIPYWILYVMVPLSAILTCIRIVQSRIQIMRSESIIK